MLAVLASCLAVALQTAPAERPATDGRLGPYLGGLRNLAGPVDVAYAPDGGLWILERDAHRVSVQPRVGGRVAIAGRPGRGDGELRFPRGLALLEGGGCLVSDTENDRVVRFAADGAFEGVEVGVGGRFDLALRWPEGLDARGDRLVVCDRGRGRVLVLGGSEPVELDGGLLDPVDAVFLDDGGALAVADAGLHEVVIFGGDGAVTRRVGGFGHFPGQFAAPTSVDFAAGRLYVADSDNHRVQVFDRAGELLYDWGKHAVEPDQGAGYFHYPRAVAALPNGLAAAVVEDFDGRLQRFGPAEGPASDYRNDPGTQSAEAAGHVGPPLAAAGRLVVTIEPETQELHFHDLGLASGTPIRVHRAGGFGPAPGQFRGLVDVALAADGRRVLALDGRDRRLSEFVVGALGEDGPRQDRRLAAFARSVDLHRLVPDLGGAEALAVADDGRVLIVDGARRRIVEVAADWKSARTLAVEAALSRPVDLALAPDGERLAVADAGARAVLVFDRAGQLVDRIGAGPEHLLPGAIDPGGLTFDGSGRLLVSDRRRRAILAAEFLEGGGVQLGLVGGSRAAGAAEYREPRGIALGPRDWLIVVDHGNHLLTVVERDGRFVSASGPRAYLEAARDGADQDR